MGDVIQADFKRKQWAKFKVGDLVQVYDQGTGRVTEIKQLSGWLSGNMVCYIIAMPSGRMVWAHPEDVTYPMPPIGPGAA